MTATLQQLPHVEPFPCPRRLGVRWLEGVR
jgi:hypothetical protein